MVAPPPGAILLDDPGSSRAHSRGNLSAHRDRVPGCAGRRPGDAPAGVPDRARDRRPGRRGDPENRLDRGARLLPGPGEGTRPALSRRRHRCRRASTVPEHILMGAAPLGPNPANARFALAPSGERLAHLLLQGRPLQSGLAVTPPYALTSAV